MIFHLGRNISFKDTQLESKSCDWHFDDLITIRKYRLKMIEGEDGDEKKSIIALPHPLVSGGMLCIKFVFTTNTTLCKKSHILV